MHEASAVEALLGMLTEELAGRPLGARVTRIRLVAGESTGYRMESLAFYLGVLGKGTRLEGAELEVRYVKPLLRCAACGAEFERERFSFDCPACGGRGEMTRTGSEFYVDSIELEGP